MTWSARIEGDVLSLCEGDRLVLKVSGLDGSANADVLRIVDALNAYGPSNVLMREIAMHAPVSGELIYRTTDRWATAASMIMSTKSKVRAVTMVEIGNVPTPENGE